MASDDNYGWPFICWLDNDVTAGKESVECQTYIPRKIIMGFIVKVGRVTDLRTDCWHISFEGWNMVLGRDQGALNSKRFFFL